MKRYLLLLAVLTGITSAQAQQVRVNPGSGLRVATSAYAASLVIKNESGILLSVVGYNSKATAQFIQLHDAASLPADAAVPILTFQVPATSVFSVEIPFSGIPFNTGIVVCNSSTGPTKTIGSADCWFLATVQ